MQAIKSCQVATVKHPADFFIIEILNWWTRICSLNGKKTIEFYRLNSKPLAFQNEYCKTDAMLMLAVKSP